MTSDHSAPSGSRHVGLFLRRMLRRPGRVVALSPSSTRLAMTMARDLGPDTGPVIELGAGTGVITRAILARGVPEDRLTLYEIEAEFADLLRGAFPHARLVEESAALVGAGPAGDTGAVVSGLPLLSMPAQVQRAIVEGAFRRLRPGGIFVQFTYGWAPPVREAIVESLGLALARSRPIWLNLPPARVYTFRRGTD